MPGIFAGSVVLPLGSFQAGTGPIFLSDLKCSEHDENLLQCPNRYHTPPGLIQECDHTQDAGVKCEGQHPACACAAIL